MSLCCAECDRMMGPSEKLPGHDGVMVSPVLSSLVWRMTQQQGERQWVLLPVLAEVSRSLCFRCIKEKLLPERLPVLVAIYEAINAETRYGAFEMQSRGKWRRADDDRCTKLFEAFLAKVSAFDRTACLFCGRVPEKPELVSLRASALDKVYCRQFHAGLPGESNYSITNYLKLGMTGFALCFDCSLRNIPRVCRFLSIDLGATEASPRDAPRSSLQVPEKLLKAFRQEVGTQEAEKMLKELKENADIHITGPGQN